MMGDFLFFIVAVSALILGLIIWLNPTHVIASQIKFYALINWKVEPISMAKEIRNTQFMGLFLVGFDLITVVYYFLR